MGDKFFVLLADIFYNLTDKGYDGYTILKCSVPLDQLHKLYNRLEVKEIPPIETLPDEEKIKYWNIAKMFYQDEPTAIICSKASYMLSLITGLN